MAANSFAAQNGTEKLSTDALTTVNGVNVAADMIEVQRMKMGFGADSDYNDVSAATPLPARITNGSVNAGVEPFGALQINGGFTTLFYDSWPGTTLDTTEKWTVTGTAPTISGGNMQMAATPSTYNAIRTKDTVRPNVGFTLVRNGIQLEMAAATGCGRFVGLGTPSTTPSAVSLAQDGIGTEVDQATGNLLAVTYAAGVRTTVATLTRPTDGATHPIGVYFRVTQAYWTLDGAVVASQAFPNVPVVELPALIVRQNAAAFVGVPAFVNIAHLTADTSRQGFGIADPVIGTRMARVGANGAMRVDVDGNRAISYRGRASTFRIPGRAGTAGQKLFSLHNATGSTLLVDVDKFKIDLVSTVAKAVTVLPPVVRLYKVTVLPTNGNAVTKVARDSAQSSSASLTVLQDASADGTSSATALTATLPAGAVIEGEFAQRLITAAGYEVGDAIQFLKETDELITLRALEGLVVMLDYTLATQNPITDMWVVTAKWTEYTAV